MTGGQFLLTRPSRDVTCISLSYSHSTEISTHTPLAGRDPHLLFHTSRGDISTHTPLAGRDDQRKGLDQFRTLISTHTPLAGRDSFRDLLNKEGIISTHTPLAGRDGHTHCMGYPDAISTHTPLAGRDQQIFRAVEDLLRFLLTRPSRDVTLPLLHLHIESEISTHTPLAGRDLFHIIHNDFFCDFYSHAPRGT